MGKYHKIITAGPLVAEAMYPAPNPRDSIPARAEKHRMTTEAQKRLNYRYAWQRLEMLIAANFGASDYYITLTYTPEDLPATRAAAQAEIGKYIRRVRQVRREKGKEVKYIYATEHRHGDSRWHHHLIVNGCSDLAELLALWTRGIVNGIQLHFDRDHTYEALAKYLCKEQRDTVGQRLWCSSHGLTQPTCTCTRVSNDAKIHPPKGSAILDDTGDVRTEYGSFRYIKYVLPPRRRRRKILP